MLGIKQQAQVAAHVSVQVSQDFRGQLLKFSDCSVFADKVLRLSGKRPQQKRRRKLRKSLNLMQFLMKPFLIAQKLG